MIFKSFDKLSGKTEKSFFAEQINVYIRLVQVFCEKKGYVFQKIKDTDTISEMIDMGVIEKAEQIEELKKYLNSQFEDFETAVSISIFYNSEMDGLLDKLSNKRRRMIQEAAAKKKRYSLVDFFCGAGGLSLGFLQQGFNVKLANDIEDVCIQTYKYNHPELPSDKLIQGDIKEIVDHIEEYIAEPIDIVVGGPPCQGFSEANRQRVIDDPRNKLYKYFVQAVEKIAPKFVVMENVKGMLKVAEQVVEDYGKLRVDVGGSIYSYLVDYKILVSHDFGVAQSRERLIYIAIRSDIASQKGITPKDIFVDVEQNYYKDKYHTLAEALEYIKELEAPRVKNMNEVDSDVTGKKIDVNMYEGDDNEYLRLINLGRKIPYLYNHKARYLSDVNYEIYEKLNQGDDASDEKIRDIMPYAHRLHCFKDKYFKLYADRPCRTITAHLRMDCHSHIHPYQVRALTPREAARVQSFPDDYLFWGAYLKTYMQVGNAVPPMMARGIAESIKKYL